MVFKLYAGIDEKDISAGGRQLEKAVPNTALGQYFVYVGAVSYLGFVKKRRDEDHSLHTADEKATLSFSADTGKDRAWRRP